MKKTLIIAALLAGAVSVYSQGQMNFYNDLTYSGSTLNAPIFNPSTATTTQVTYNGYTVNEEIGDVATGNPTGSSVYSGAPLKNTATTTGFDAQLFGSTAANDTLADLVPMGTVMSFYTQTAAAGFIKGSQTITFGGSSPVATIAIAAWQNTGTAGAATTLAAAQADGYAWGFSNLANELLAVSPATPTAMPTTIESFSLGTSVPEPSTIALGVMGVSALLFRRRK